MKLSDTEYKMIHKLIEADFDPKEAKVYMGILYQEGKMEEALSMMEQEEKMTYPAAMHIMRIIFQKTATESGAVQGQNHNM